MLLLNEPFSELAGVTDTLSASMAQGRDEDTHDLLTEVARRNQIDGVLVVWAELISLVWPSGEDAFQQVRNRAPHSVWLAHASAMVQAAGAGDITRLFDACKRTLDDLADDEVIVLLRAMAPGVRSVLDWAGGIQWLRESVGLHRACANPRIFDSPSRERLLSPAGWVIAAIAAGQYEAARERTATLFGASADAWEWMSAVWLQVASVLMAGEGRLVEADSLSGLPTAMIDPGAPHPHMRHARLVQTVIGAVHRRDQPALNAALGDMITLDSGDKAVLIWLLSRTVGARYGQLLREAGEDC